MLNAPWYNITSLHCADKAVAYWSDIFKKYANKHMPVVRKKLNVIVNQTGLMIKLGMRYKQKIFIQRKTILEIINHGGIR